MMSDAFAHFEQAEVHEALEEADHDTYESFEAALESYLSGLESGSSDGAERYAAMARTGGFAVAGAVEAAPPVDAAGADGGEEDNEEADVEGGPNVVKGTPDDADHVVDMNAVAFDPESLTIQQGDTVAWTHAGGEAHSVSAYEDSIPEAASYWASGDFDSESAAREGWENGVGYVQSGQSYVRTFETTGTHEYFCIPHEAAGMEGKVIVE
jgi:plastocyanin